MFKYDFQIDILDGNGLRDLTELGTNPFIGFSDKHPLNEELDNGVYTILSTRKGTFPIFSYFEITITDDDENTLTRKFYIARDEVKTINKMQNGTPLYEHTLSTIELTKKFEKFITEFYCFTQSSDPNITFYTLNDALHRIMRITPIGEDDITANWVYGNDYSLLPKPENRAFDRISDKITDLGDIEIPQMFLDNGTLREKLNEILKVINGIARLDTYQAIRKKQLLTVDLYNNLRNILENIPTESENDDIGIEEYNSNFETFLDNNVNEVRDSSSQITYPAKDGVYDRLKASEENYSISDSNCGIRTEYPIYRVDKLYIPITLTNIEYKTSTDGPSYYLTDTSIVLEISNRVVEEDVYNSLPLGKSDYSFEYNDGVPVVAPITQSSTIVYKYRTNYINCSNNHKEVFFTLPHFNTMIATATAEKFFTNNNQLPSVIAYAKFYIQIGLSNNITSEVTLETQLGGKKIFIETRSAFSPWNYQYRIKYTPIYDTHFATDKNSTDIAKVYSTNLENQGSRIMSFQNFSQHLLSSSQRVGVNEREIAVRHEKLTDLLYNGDYFEDTNEIITICEYIYNNHYILGKYTLSKDYNRINEYIGINSEIRQWQVPANVYERRILIKNYLEIDTQAQNNTSYLTELGCKTILDNVFYDPTNYSYPIFYRGSSIFYYTQNQLLNDEWSQLDSTTIPSGKTRKLLLGCSCNGGGNTILLGFKFFDNMNAMPIVVEDNNIALTSKYLIKKVPYCIPNGDYIGFLRNFNFTISNKNADFTSSNNLPFCAKANNDSNDLVKVPDMLVLKDPSEALNVAYQVSCISNNEYITIGKWFTIDNTMIKSDEVETPILRVYYSNTKHGKTFNDRINNDYVSTNNGVYNYFNANSNANDFDYSQTPYFYLQTKSAFNALINLNPNIKEIVFAELDTGKIHLVIDIRYFNITRNDQNQLVIGQNTIYFNFTKKRSKLIYDY